MPLVIGIEGYFKTGKTTLAKNLSKKYDAVILDMGILYRIIAALLFEKNFSEIEVLKLVSSYSLEEILEKLGVYYDYSKWSFSPIPQNLYSADVTYLSSSIGAATGDKWYYMFNSVIQKISESKHVILVGRNLLRVFPGLSIHVFLIANTEKITKLTLEENPNLSLESAIDYVRKREKNEKLIRTYSVQSDKTIFIDVSEKDEQSVLALVTTLIDNIT